MVRSVTKPAAPSRSAADPTLPRITAALKDAFGARLVSALLFGSHARGTAGAHSDYDVAVFLCDCEPRDRMRLSEIASELGPPGRPRIQLIGFPPDGLARRTTLMFNIRNEAVPLPGLNWPEIVAPRIELDGGQ